MSFYPEPDNHFRDKVKVALDLLNHATRKELKPATGIDKSNLAAEKIFVPLKAVFDKLYISRVVNVITVLNNL